MSYAEAVVKNSKEFIALKTNVDNLRQHKLSCNIALNGPAVGNAIANAQTAENLLNAGKALLTKLPNISSNDLQIINCHRSLNNPQILKIKLANDQIRRKLFQSFFTMEHKPFYMNEVLIPEKGKLFYELRQLKKMLADNNSTFLKSTFARNGEIYYTLESEPDKLHKVSSSEDIRILEELSKLPQQNQETTSA